MRAGAIPYAEPMLERDESSGDQSAAASAAGLDPARDAAIRRLARQANRYPDVEPGGPKTNGLDDRDAAFAHAIYDAAMRRMLTISAIVSPYLRMPFSELEPRAKGVVLAGAAQLLFLDRVPAHAVLNESVEWAKTTISPGVGSLVNAVLRRVAELREAAKVEKRPWTGSGSDLPRSDGTVLAMPTRVLLGDEWEVIARATSHPTAMIRRWSRLVGDTKAREIALHSLVEAPVIVNGEHAKSAVEWEGLTFVPHERAGFFAVEGPHAAVGEFLRSRRDVWAQDVSSARAVASVRDLSPKVVIDACAGRGTKTRQLAAVFPNARIIATDSDKPRVAALREATVHLPNVEVVEFEALAKMAGVAEIVLLDVPCSNTGVLARRIEAKYRAPGETGVNDLVVLQRRIVASALPLLGSGGMILYSTCSIEPEEDEDQVRALASEHRLSLRREEKHLPQGVPGGPATAYSDGSYSALLAK